MKRTSKNEMDCLCAGGDDVWKGYTRGLSGVGPTHPGYAGVHNGFPLLENLKSNIIPIKTGH